jgi:hypothetical protein
MAADHVLPHRLSFGRRNSRGSHSNSHSRSSSTSTSSWAGDHDRDAWACSAPPPPPPTTTTTTTTTMMFEPQSPNNPPHDNPFEEHAKNDRLPFISAEMVGNVVQISNESFDDRSQHRLALWQASVGRKMVRRRGCCCRRRRNNRHRRRQS